MRRFSEINEGLWKDGVNRAQQNKLRQEDMISLETAAKYYNRPVEYIHRVEGFDDFFFSFNQDVGMTYASFFHYPQHGRIARIYLSNEFHITPRIIDRMIPETRLNQKDKDTLLSDEFMDAFNKSVDGLDVIK